jgi:hypothetical protein
MFPRSATLTRRFSNRPLFDPSLTALAMQGVGLGAPTFLSSGTHGAAKEITVLGIQSSD